MLETKSIKKDLIITLSLLAALVLTSVSLISFIYTTHHAEEAFDANLVKSAKIIFGAIEHEAFGEKDVHFLEKISPFLQQKIFHRYEYKIHVKAWRGNDLIYNSDNNFEINKPSEEGFSNIILDNEDWRGFSFYDKKSNISILILEKDVIRDELISEIVFSLLIPFLISFILLFLIIFITVNRKLKPLEQLAFKIEKMSAQSLQTLDDKNFSIELKPFINSFNSLIYRLIESINTERNFTNYAAHELKTPLAAIAVQAHLLINNKNKDLEKEYAHDLLDGINRASHLINQLLTLSRIEPDNFNIGKEKFNFGELVTSMIKNYQEKFIEKNSEIKLECSLNKADLLIEANKTYIEIMIGNLIDNAIKYGDRDSIISILISKKSESLIFKISNKGEQILPQELDKIFDNFYRVTRLKNNKDNLGCGLGLAISKKIATIHSAKIYFESKNGLNSVEIIFP